eukprot:1291382-Rhodomonas_salina.1
MANVVIFSGLRRDLGEENYAYLTKNDILADDGSPVTFLVAAAIISIQGMKDTLQVPSWWPWGT